MLAFYEFHPLNKYASNGIATHLSSFYGDLKKSFQNKVKRIKDPQFYKDVWKDYKPEIISGVAGLPLGIYFGNEAYKNSIPRVTEFDI